MYTAPSLLGVLAAHDRLQQLQRDATTYHVTGSTMRAAGAATPYAPPAGWEIAPRRWWRPKRLRARALRPLSPGTLHHR